MPFKLFRPIDDFLNLITMYRLVLYCLISLWIVALIFSFFKYLPFLPFQFIFSSLIILLSSWISNKLLAKIFNAITNLESVYITALILIFIITPSVQSHNIIFFLFASVAAQATKYILALNKKHLFNPVAAAVFIASLLNVGNASWWVGSKIMIVPVLLIGLLIIRKVQREIMVLVFFAVSIAVIVLFSFQSNPDLFGTVFRTFTESPILFFAFIMLTEPLTTPATRNLRIIYAMVVGFLFATPFNFGSIYSTPELSLLIANIFSFLISPKKKIMLFLKEKKRLARDTYDFAFKADSLLEYNAGQYLEFTLPVDNPDSRGNRRYLTLASSPTEGEYRIAVKIPENPSKFKRKLINLTSSDKILAGNLMGDFILTKNEENIVFIGGGIGITPFRSMIKFLLDNKIKKNITLFYSNKTEDEIVYREIFNEAKNKLGIKVIYNLTDLEKIPNNWQGYKGRLSPEIIAKEVPDYKKSIFYLSGPHGMVLGFEDILRNMRIPYSQIKKDFFPGYV